MMKLLKIFLLVSFIFFLPSEETNAAFTIETDLTSVNFGVMKPGEIRGDIPFQGVTVRCTTDQGRPWTLRIRLERPLANTNNSSSVIPSENFRWYGLNSTGTGTLVTDEQDFLVERVAYTAPAGEGAGGIEIKIRFKLNVPTNSQSGDYVTRIILTFIE